MLSLQFKEGSTLSAESKVSVPLPEDDPDMMVILCKALHMRFAMKMEEMSPEILLRLGVVVDKYDCAIGMEAISHYWINKQSPAVTDKTRAQLFVASFLLKDSETFQRLGYELQMRTPGEIAVKLQETHHPEVLEGIIGERPLYMMKPESNVTDSHRPHELYQA